MTTTLINEFINLNGISSYDYLDEFIKENDLTTEFNNIYPNTTKLFEFAVKYGLCDLVVFLYEHKNVTYNMNTITNYCKSIEGGANNSLDSNNIPLVHSNGSKSGMTIMVEDKYSIGRNKCIKYLLDMKKRSKMHSMNKNFYYTCKK